MIYKGSCHCKAVQFEVKSGEHVEVEDCNCSVCSKFGFLHLIVPKQHFRLISGEQFLTEYRFNTGVAKHTFCKVCGAKPFYIPRSNPDGVDVNVRCLDTKPANITIVLFDGQNWEDNAAKLAHKSKLD
ncbi:GFA family protein [Aliiglaciecola sp. SL4]|uniref:GFA family protein n=1 Tax=Aliiglaciecola sp. SL4 TaxID=3239806 RepID=UPI00355C0498